MKRVISLFLITIMVFSVFNNLTAFVSSAAAKWSEELTEDGWMHVANEDGADLGYHPDSGMQLIMDNGWAFKDMAGDGELYPYMDWRLDANTRAADLASRLSLEQLAALMISGTTAPLNGSAIEQILWANELQANAENASSYSIPVNVIAVSEPDYASSWPSGLALASTFDSDLAAKRASKISKEMRTLGIHTYLGPMANLATEPRWNKVHETFGEDPALSRDLIEATVNAFQSTTDSSGTDLGWGTQSVSTVMTHWPGTGPSEGGRAGSRWWGAYNVYPGEQFETHLIPFVDGGLHLDGRTEMSAGVMTSYGIVWEEDGEDVGSSFSFKQNQLLRSYGFDGVIYADWDIHGELGHGSNVQYFLPHERILLAILAGTDMFVDMSGTANIDYVLEAIALAIDLVEGNYVEPTGIMEIAGETINVEYDEENADSEARVGSADLRVIINPLETLLPALNLAFDITEGMNGEETMRARLEESGRRILANSIKLGLFENPYVEAAESLAVLSNHDHVELGEAAQLQSVIMLKNDGVISKNWAGDRPTVYVPMTLNNEGRNHTNGTPDWTAGTRVPLEVLEEYFNVITDTVAESTTNASPGDIIRASADDIARADFILVFMETPMNALDNQNNGVPFSAWYPEIAPWDYHFINIGHIDYVPISMQYRTYRATNDNVRQPSIAGRSIWWFLAGVYGDDASHEDESRAYFGQRSSIINSHELELLFDVVDSAPEGVPVIVAMNAERGYVFREFEEDVDAILMGFDVDYSSFLPLVLGSVEPSGLLPIQMPASMVIVEGNNEDVPRDMEVYVDSLGNAYDFSFGLNWSGRIDDARTKKYNVPALVTPKN